MTIQILVGKNISTQNYEFYIRRDDGKIAELHWRDVVPGEWSEPTILISDRLGGSTMQALADKLWECGIRPTEAAGSAGSLSATKYHLEDMRKLVFKEHP